MAKELKFELVSPERLLFSAKVGAVIVPGAEGDFGVLPDHSSLISLVRPGVICILADGAKVSERIFVEGGFAEVNEAGCTILAEKAQKVEEIDRAKAEQALTEANEDLADAKDESQRQSAHLALAIAQARVTALGAGTY